MFPTRIRALYSTHLRRQMAASRWKGQNNALLLTAGLVAIVGGTYYMGFWGMDPKAQEKVQGKSF
ncbi:hypothetical protein R3P38DRAFT_2880515 [Favolaschia claudopus]|uniref:Uncharacterized protein n=1 Tax=Favolaschia claudopus TaxID=2862362 RepID=A0AAW0D186_9AGAR